MKTIYLVLFIFLNSLPGISQPDDLKNRIIWEKDRPLTWNDFKGSTVKSSKFFAQTSSGIYYHVQQLSQTHFSVFVETFFDPGQSWQKKNEVTDYLLKHEQLHFDIHELYSRLLIKSLLETEFDDVNKAFVRLRELYANASQGALDFSSLYDEETNHSVDERQQMAWNLKVEAMLAETIEYDRKEIIVEVKPKLPGN